MNARVAVLVAAALAGCRQQPPRTTALSVCDLSRDFTAHRDRVIAVRGVYFQGLRQQCPQTCATGPWPSFVDLVDGRLGDASWAELAQAQVRARQEARQGRRVEICVTVRGRLKTRESRSPVGPCDSVTTRSYGHLGAFPAQIVAEGFSDIQVIPNAASPYDYSTMYNGVW
jgi:hypothetical protein